MGILDKLGIKKKGEASKEEVRRETQGASQKQEKKEDKPQKKNVLSSQAHKILIRPILSEKATHLATLGEYVFVVHPGANKSEIKKSIQKVYDVHVVGVKIVKLPGKQRRYGRTQGRTSAWKKAIVKVKEGEKIPGIIEAVG